MSDVSTISLIKRQSCKASRSNLEEQAEFIRKARVHLLLMLLCYSLGCKVSTSEDVGYSRRFEVDEDTYGVNMLIAI